MKYQIELFHGSGNLVVSVMWYVVWMSRSGAWVYAAKLTVDGLADKIPAGGTELHLVNWIN